MLKRVIHWDVTSFLSFQIVLDTLPLSFQLETKTIDRKTKNDFIYYKYFLIIFFDYYCYTIDLLVDLGQDPEGAQGWGSTRAPNFKLFYEKS